MQKELAIKIERLAIKGRLNDLNLLSKEGEITQARKMYSVLKKLDHNVFLIGSGPYSQEVFSLMADEIVIGRDATPLEQTLDKPIDVFVNDAVQ